MLRRGILLVLVMTMAAACGATYTPVIPTSLPTITPTFTPTDSPTPGGGATATNTPSPVPASPTGGPSPTPLLGPSRTPAPDDPTATRVPNPNAPRIELFTADLLAVQPGESLTLYWSVRGVDNAVIYRLDSSGQRTNVWNVPPDGNQTVTTRRSDRGQAQFVLIAGEGDLQIQQLLTIPLACPLAWFFTPPPDTCADGDPQPTTLIEQPFERGRMVYVQAENVVYALFNDGRTPAWVAFENRYDPAVHPEKDENFVNPPGLFQPIGALGFLWRGNDTVRNRLGLGTQQEVVYEGFVQAATLPGETAANLYISSANATVVQLVPGGTNWQIITPS